MSCNMPEGQVLSALTRVGGEFSTLDFITVCPHSGGTKEGTACSIVRSEKRQACGKRLAEFARAHPAHLKQTSPAGRSPALWLDRSKAPTTASPAPSPVAPPPEQRLRGQSPLYARHLARQIQWKERVGVSACGLHQGQPRAYLFPEGQWEHNLLPQFRQGVLDHLATHGIERHSFAHHVMSSQAFALNLAAPFFMHPEALLPVLQALLPPGRVAARIDKVEAEVSDPQNRFHEPGQRGANCTSSDLGIWWTDAEDRRSLLLVEVKYTESEFGACKKGNDHGGACATGGREIIASEGALCPLTGPAYGRTYWTWMRLLNVFRTEVLETSTACPFRQDGYQLMRNQVLAAVLEQDPGLHRVDFAVMMHDDNETVRTLEVPLAGSTDVLLAWRSVLKDPSRFFALSPRRWLDVASRDPGLAPWAGAMIERYFGESGGRLGERSTSPPS